MGRDLTFTIMSHMIWLVAHCCSSLFVISQLIRPHSADGLQSSNATSSLCPPPPHHPPPPRLRVPCARALLWVHVSTWAHCEYWRVAHAAVRWWWWFHGPHCRSLIHSPPSWWIAMGRHTSWWEGDVVPPRRYRPHRQAVAREPGLLLLVHLEGRHAARRASW